MTAPSPPPSPPSPDATLLAPSQREHLTCGKVTGMRVRRWWRRHSASQDQNWNTWFDKWICDIYIFFIDWILFIHLLFSNILEFLGYLNSLQGQGNQILVNGRGPEHMWEMMQGQGLKPKCLQGGIGTWMRRGPAGDGGGVQTGDSHLKGALVGVLQWIGVRRLWRPRLAWLSNCSRETRNLSLFYFGF